MDPNLLTLPDRSLTTPTIGSRRRPWNCSVAVASERLLNFRSRGAGPNGSRLEGSGFKDVRSLPDFDANGWNAGRIDAAPGCKSCWSFSGAFWHWIGSMSKGQLS